jgi:hypothetical protein
LPRKAVRLATRMAMAGKIAKRNKKLTKNSRNTAENNR